MRIFLCVSAFGWHRKNLQSKVKERKKGDTAGDEDGMTVLTSRREGSICQANLGILQGSNEDHVTMLINVAEFRHAADENLWHIQDQGKEALISHDSFCRRSMRRG